MALTPDDLLGTPVGYATPDQIGSVQDYAKLLMQGATRDQPIVHPAQGWRMLANALSGNIMRNRLGGMQRQNAAMLGNAQTNVLGSAYPQTDIGQSSDAQLPQPSQISAVPSGAASVRNNNPGAQWPGPIASQYGATGSQTIGGGNKIATFPDPVSGAAAEFALLEKRYSGMPLGSAITKWSGGNSSPAYAQFIAKRTGLTPDTVISPQLLRSPQGVALAKAMADWEAGGNSPLGPREWTQAQQRAFGGGQRPQIAPGQTADLSGSIGGVGAAPTLGGGIPTGAPPPPAAGSPAAMSRALAPNGPQMAAGSGGTATPPAGALPPMPSAGNPAFGPQYMQQRPQLSLEGLRQMLTNPILSDEMKAYYMQMYQEQFQPVTAPAPGGTWIQPGHAPGAPPAGPPLFQGNVEDYETKSGDTTYKQPFQYERDPKTGQVYRRPVQTQQPPAAPTELAPPAPDKFDLNKPTSTPKPQSMAVPPTGGPPGTAPPMGGAPGVASAETGKPVRVASLGNVTGPVPDSPKATTPPGPVPPTMLTQPPPSTGGTQTAQYVDPYTKGTVNELQDMSATGAAKKATAEGFAKQYTDAYQAGQGAAQAARNTLPNLRLMRQLADDPNFPAGLFANGRLNLQKLQAWLGDNPNAGRAGQAFDKLINGETLDALKAAWSGAGLGQVRLAEFQTLAKSLVSRENSPEAIKALLDIMIKTHERIGDVGELQDLFQDGYRYDANGHLTRTGPSSKEGPAVNEWNKTLRKYIEKNPVITDEDINTLHRFTSQAPPGEETTYINSNEGKPGPQPETPEDAETRRAIEERNRRQGK